MPLQGWHYLYDKHRAKCSRKEAARDRRTIRERMAVSSTDSVHTLLATGTVHERRSFATESAR